MYTPLSKRCLQDRLQTDSGAPHETGRRAGSVTGSHSTRVIKSGQAVSRVPSQAPGYAKSASGNQQTRYVCWGRREPCTCCHLQPVSSSTEGHIRDSGHSNLSLTSDSTLLILPECFLFIYTCLPICLARSRSLSSLQHLTQLKAHT